MDKSEEKDQTLSQFRALYMSNAPRLICYASKYVDAITAEDLVHDVFYRVWQKKVFLYLNEELKTYLFRAIQHACLDYLKHQEVKGNYIERTIRELKIEEIYYNDDPQSLISQDDRIARIYKEIEKLPEKCREVFIMSYLEERKTAEIAAILNISPRTVEAQLYKALKTLRNVFISLFLFFLHLA